MTDARTPLQKLDDAIAEYLVECEVEGTLSGWVLGYQTSMLTNEPQYVPVMFDSDFTFGAGTSPEAAIGLARITEARLERQLIDGPVDDDD